MCKSKYINIFLKLNVNVYVSWHVGEYKKYFIQIYRFLSLLLLLDIHMV